MREASGLTNLCWATRIMAYAAARTVPEAEAWARAVGAPAEALRIISKGAVGSGGSGELGSSGGVGIASWIESAQNASAFYRLLADSAVRRLPARTRAAITSKASASIVAEAESTPLARVTVQTVQLVPVKVQAVIAETIELLSDIGSAGQMALAKSVLNAVADAVDAAFIEMITSTATPSTASSGTTAVAAKHDLRTALLSVNPAGNSKPYWICAPDVAVKASTLTDAGGLDAFASMSPVGGELAALPCLVSSGVADGELILVDAASVVADGGPVTSEIFRHGDILMSDAPTMSSGVPTPASLVSLWQTNTCAIRASAIMAALPLRDDAVHVTTGIDWGSGA